MNIEALKILLGIIVSKAKEAEKEEDKYVTLKFHFKNEDMESSEIIFDEETVIEFYDNSLFLIEYQDGDSNHYLFDVEQIGKVTDAY